MNTALLKEFTNPGSAYRGKPFWAWNGTLEPQELRRQIRIMHHMGLGGFFMHSRVGLNTAYLSDEWFDCVRACIDEAEKLDMEAWLYDEDRWPSGAAGGLVTKNPAYRAKALVMTVYSRAGDLKWGEGTVAAFTARLDGETAYDVKRIAKGKRPPRLKKGVQLLVFKVHSAATDDWYNGQTYLDTMDTDAVREFVRVTHKAYQKEVGSAFGKRVPGIFTDEPNVSTIGSGISEGRVQVPWTKRLPRVFRQRYGYDLLSCLPEVFLNVDGETSSKARWQFFDCVAFLFADAFARQIGEWCDTVGIQHTGHVLAEETLRSQTLHDGSCMRFYEYMQAPGMDILSEQRREYDTAKQVSSAARQFGRKWRLTETYGCTGWDFPFAGHKAIGDWQTALGINLRCQHLSWYTMEGQAKRDYPAGIFYQSPWWVHYEKVEDYFARVLAVMTRGREVRDVLVIHPLESCWALFSPTGCNDKRIERLERDMVSVRDTLLSAHLDFDYGDEDIMARHGRVTRRRGEPRLRVAKADYQTVVVPPMLTIRSSTLSLLKRFRAAGGEVIFAGPAPKLVDAEASAQARELARECIRTRKTGSALADAVAAAGRRISIADAEGKEIAGALYLLREDKEAAYLFVCNTGHRKFKPIQTEVPVRARTAKHERVLVRGFEGCEGAPLQLDPETGEVCAATATRAGKGWSIQTDLPALASRLFVVPKVKQGETCAVRKPLRSVRTTALGTDGWGPRLSEDNCLVLDRPSYSIDGSEWQAPEEILRIDFKVRDALGLGHRGGSMVQPWARPEVKNPRRIPVDLAYAFEVAAMPTGRLQLALERPETASVRVNGVVVPMDAKCGWWCDRSLQLVPIEASLLHKGENTIAISYDYDESHSGLEIAYLLGQFGTRVNGTRVALTGAPTTLRTGDWVRQGLAFYSGSVGYAKTIRPRLRRGERLFVHVPDYRGVGVRILVDGEPAGVIGWEPNEVEITELVSGPSVELCVEVLGHRRNSHGPLHHSEKWPSWTGPAEFVTEGDGWVDGYQLVPCGLMAPPELTVRK